VSGFEFFVGCCIHKSCETFNVWAVNLEQLYSLENSLVDKS
jgi:hypothetical protein